MYSFAIILLVAYVQVITAQSYDKNTCNPGPHDIPNPSPEPDTQSPDIWYYQIPTTTVVGNDDDGNDDDDDGMIMLEVHRAWAPIGADRFYSLVQDNYYDCAAFFRIVPNFIIQWGIASNPLETSKWQTDIQDDPVLESNTVGMVSFAMAGPNTRTTQIFVNTEDNLGLDGQGFAPFAKVIQGMDTVFTSMYVPSPVPDQTTYQTQGNQWILQYYPDIDIIKGGVSPNKILLSLNETVDESAAAIITTDESPTTSSSNATTSSRTLVGGNGCC